MKFRFGRDTGSARLREIENLLKEVEYSTEPPPDADERDRIAVEYEDAFAGRFGFRWPRAARQALIETKNRCGASDLDVRKLYFSGNLKQRGTRINIYGETIGEIAGWTSIALLTLIPGLLVASQFWTPTPILSLIGKSIMACLFSYGFSWCIYQLLIFPNRIQKRVRD